MARHPTRKGPVGRRPIASSARNRSTIVPKKSPSARKVIARRGGKTRRPTIR